MRFLIPLALLLLAAASPPVVPLDKTFAHWTVACDNAAHCEARGFGESSHADLRIIRDAGRSSPILFICDDGLFHSGTVQLDGQPVPVAYPDWLSSYAGDALSTTKTGTALAFLDRAQAAALLTLEAGSATPETIPLDGLPEALRTIDEVQHRAGTPDAFTLPRGANPVPAGPARAPRPVWRRPAPLTTPVALNLVAIATHDPAITQARTTAGCTIQTGAGAYALDATHALVLLPCKPDPAAPDETPSATVGIIPRHGGPPALFTPGLPVTPSFADLAASLPHANFIRASGELDVFARGDPAASCGYAALWIWAAGAFRLAHMTYGERCGGAAHGHWPLLYNLAPAR